MAKGVTALSTALSSAEFLASPIAVKQGKEAWLKVYADDDAVDASPTGDDAVCQDWSLDVSFETSDITPIGYGDKKLKVSAGRTVGGSLKMLNRRDSRVCQEFIGLFAKYMYDADGSGSGAPAEIPANPDKKIVVFLGIDATSWYQAEVVVTKVAHASGNSTGQQTLDVTYEVQGDLYVYVKGAA